MYVYINTHLYLCCTISFVSSAPLRYSECSWDRLSMSTLACKSASFTRSDKVLERIIRELPYASGCVLHFGTVTSMHEWLWWVDLGWQPCAHKVMRSFCHSSSTSNRGGENVMKGLWFKIRTKGSLRNYCDGQNKLNLGNSILFLSMLSKRCSQNHWWAQQWVSFRVSWNCLCLTWTSFWHLLRNPPLQHHLLTNPCHVNPIPWRYH